MSEWKTAKLSDVATIRFSNVDKRTNAGELPVLLCNYLDVYGHDYITAHLPFMEATATQEEINKFRVEKGDVIITKDSETPDDIGIAAVIIEDVEQLVCGYHLALLKPQRDLINSTYLLKQLGTAGTFSYFSRRANGSTRYGLSSSTIASLPISIAPLHQQHKIAEILSTLDAAIEQTEALIAKLEKVKAGMLHDLFTRGVTPDGRLRLSRAEAPDLYKQSPLGWIPNDWGFRSIAVVAEALVDGPFGSNLKTEHYVSDGVRVVRLQNIIPGRYNDEDRAFVSEQHARHLSRNSVKSGDILIAGLGEDNNVVGRACCYPTGLPAAINKADCFRLRCYAVTADDTFVMNFLNTEMARMQVRQFEQGVTRRRINLSNLRRVLVVLPSILEQRQIVRLINQITVRIESLETVRRKWLLLKDALMADLLTGRVRVPEKVAA